DAVNRSMNRERPARGRGVMRLLSLLLLTATLPLGGCQALQTWVVGHVSPIEWKEQKRVELPLSFSAWGSPTIPGRVMGGDVVALVDTGSTGSGISRSFATETGVHLWKHKQKVNGKTLSSAEDVQVQIGSVSTTVLLVPIDDGDQVPFMLGMNLFLQ